MLGQRLVKRGWNQRALQPPSPAPYIPGPGAQTSLQGPGARVLEVSDVEPVEYQLVLTTCSDAESAQTIARALVEERLAACVNILPPMQSIYRWHGQIESASEQLLMIKIRRGDYSSVEQRIRQLHSYELPEVIAVPILTGLPAYLAWLSDPDRAT